MRRHLIVTRMYPIPYDDCQSFFSVFTQISPAEETFGWKILVVNQPTATRIDQCDMEVSNDAYISVAQQGIHV